MSDTDYTETMDDIDSNDTCSRIYHWLWDNMKWYPGHWVVDTPYSEDECEKAFALRPVGGSGGFVIDVLPAVKELRYHDASQWLFDGDNCREDIPAFPPFIRFGKCECNFALKTSYIDNIGIVSLDGCPSEVVGNVDLTRCVSLKSLDGMPVSITGGDLVVPKMINDGYTELNSPHWFSDDSFIPVLKPRRDAKE